MNRGQQKTVIVLGPPRSGTSLTSAILQIIGVDMGRVSPSVKSNPKGDWEDIDFVRLNKEIITATGKSYGTADVPSEKEIDSIRSNFGARIKTLVGEKSQHKHIWGWKDPHTILTINLFLPHINNPHIVVVTRNTHDTAISYKKLLGDTVPFEEAFALVTKYETRLVRFVERHPKPPILRVSFQSLTTNPTQEAKKIATFLDIPLTRKTERAVANFVIPQDRVDLEKKKAKLKRKVFIHIPRTLLHKTVSFLKHK